MRKTPWITLFWPGLPQLWLEGSWTGLATAVLAAALLDVLLLSNLIWVELFEPAVVRTLAVATVAFWGVSAFQAARSSRAQNAAIDGPTDEDLFRQAQNEYLQGDYFQAEASLTMLLGRSPRDAEARLLWATLLRHSKRYEEADEQLVRLGKLETSAYWRVEITAERHRLKQLRKVNKTPSLPMPTLNRTSTQDHLTADIQLPGKQEKLHSTTKAA